MSRRVLNQLFPPFLALLICLVLLLIARSSTVALSLIGIGGLVPALLPVLETLSWVAAGWVTNRAIDVFLWHSHEIDGRGSRTPKLLRMLVAFSVWGLVATAVTGFVFGQSTAGIIATSSVAAAVLGFALQRLIGDVFAGVALNIENPMHLGDWVEIDGAQIGRVVEINWRATHLLTEDNLPVIIPNGRVAAARLVNYGDVQYAFRSSVDVRLDFSVPPERAERIFIAATASVDNVLLEPEPPSVRIRRFDDWGVVYNVRWYNRNFPRLSRIRHDVSKAIWHHLDLVGVQMAQPALYEPGNGAIAFPPAVNGARMQVLPASQTSAPLSSVLTASFLSKVDLLQGLSEVQLQRLAAQVNNLTVPAGQDVVRQGEPGSSLFLVREGLLHVFAAGEDGTSLKVGQLPAGTFFGELSLLTGAPRGATVRTFTEVVLGEVTKEAVEPILLETPELAEAMSEVLAARQLRNQKAFVDANAHQVAEIRQSFASDMLHRIRGFFGLAGRSALPSVGPGS